MATSVRMHRACPKYFIDLPPRTLITPKIIRTVGPSDTTTHNNATLSTSCAHFSSDEESGKALSGNNQQQTANCGDNKKFSQFAANRIVPNLWLGSHADAFSAEELRAHGILNVLNVALECTTPDTLTTTQGDKTPIRVKHVMLEDHSDENITAYFEECNSFIYDAIENRHEGVLVHCRMGVSRSATIVIAYLMEHGKRYQQHQQWAAANNNNDNSCPWACQLNSPLVIAEHLDVFQQHADALSSCGTTPATSTSTSTSSSPSVSLDWLCYNDAFDIVKAARPEISPNLGFCIALREFDTRHTNVGDDSWKAAGSIPK